MNSKLEEQADLSQNEELQEIGGRIQTANRSDKVSWHQTEIASIAI